MDSRKKHSIHDQQSYVVRETLLIRRSRQLGVFLLFLGLPALAAVLTYYFYGSEERGLQKLVDAQELEIDRLSKEIDYANQMQINAEVGSDVDRLAVEDLRKQLVGEQDRNTRLEEQINFYKSLMDPNPTKSGVYLESVEVEPSQEASVYNYRIVIAQRSSNHSRVTGAVRLELISEKNSDGIQRISLGRLTDGQDRLTLGFKFFQQLDGSLTLPDGFSPEKMRLQVKTNGRAAADFEEFFDWKLSP